MVQPHETVRPAAMSLKEATASQQAAFTTLAAFCQGQPDRLRRRVLAGYAGTGKTWLVTHLVRAACDAGLRVAVCAPTHKALAVIAAKLDACDRNPVWVGTLHALLGLKLTEHQDGTLQMTMDRRPNGTYLEHYDMVFVDEASMVGPVLLAHIERTTRRTPTRILFIGDPGQLLPVVTRPAPEDAGQAVLATADEIPMPPVFQAVAAQTALTEIVRQKATGRPHPIVQFAQEIRRYIEGQAEGVFGPDAIRFYLDAHRDEIDPGVRLTESARIAHGVMTLRQRRPHKDIRAIAWRNRVVDECNRVIHAGLAGIYPRVVSVSPPPFWVGETVVAREALYAFRPSATMRERDPLSWERALAPQGKGRGAARAFNELVELVANNTEMIVQSCDALRHPYLNIASWHVVAELPDHHIVEFFVADDPREHRRQSADVWNAYRQGAKRHDAAFRHAWAVTRACAPVTHAYALTAHKSQGSTFHYVLVDLHDLQGLAADDPHGYHRAFYVAVTRATERVWLGL